MLIEAGPRVLPSFHVGNVGVCGEGAAPAVGVEVVFGQPVTDVRADGVTYGSTDLAAGLTIIWAAGVLASPAAQWLFGVKADRAGRVMVEPDLRCAATPDIFAIGDTVAINGPDGKQVRGIAPAAKQQGRYVAQTIETRLRGETLAPFRHRHSGSLAQIGKRKAVIDFGCFKFAALSLGGSGASPTSTS